MATEQIWPHQRGGLSGGSTTPIIIKLYSRHSMKTVISALHLPGLSPSSGAIGGPRNVEASPRNHMGRRFPKNPDDGCFPARMLYRFGVRVF